MDHNVMRPGRVLLVLSVLSVWSVAGCRMGDVCWKELTAEVEVRDGRTIGRRTDGRRTDGQYLNHEEQMERRWRR